MPQRISVVNSSTGKFREESINGRAHVVTSMLTIEGNSVMNSLFYPLDVVTQAAPQLDMLPAPDGHPTSGGKFVSAFNPLATNAHNFGGFTRAPKVEGNRVTAELVVDIEIANRTKRGRAIVQRIKGGRRIGVSTGLVANVSEAAGESGGEKFTGRIDSIKFDHVAILLDHAPAGANTYTLNHDITRKKIRRGILMDEITFDLTPLAASDRVLISGMTVNQLLEHVKREPTIDEAKSVVEKGGFFMNQAKADDVEEFLANKEEFSAFKKVRTDKRNETIDFIVANSKMKKDQLTSIPDDALESIAASVAPKNKRVMNRSGGPVLELIDDNAPIAQGA